MRTADPLAGKRVGDLMVRDPVTAARTRRSTAFVERIAWGQRLDAYPVVEAGRAVGIMPLQRPGPGAARRVAHAPRGRLHAPPGPAAHADGRGRPRGGRAAPAPSGIGRALVLDGERLVGLLSLSDVARAVA